MFYNHQQSKLRKQYVFILFLLTLLLYLNPSIILWFFLWFFLSVSFLNTIKNIAIHDFHALSHLVFSTTSLHIIDWAVFYWLEVLLPSFDNCISTFSFFNWISLLWWASDIHTIAMIILKFFQFVLLLASWLQSFVIDSYVLVEVFLTKILDSFLHALFSRINQNFKLIDKSPCTFVSRNHCIFSICKH